MVIIYIYTAVAYIYIYGSFARDHCICIWQFRPFYLYIVVSHVAILISQETIFPYLYIYIHMSFSQEAILYVYGSFGYFILIWQKAIFVSKEALLHHGSFARGHFTLSGGYD